mgnify:FL=1
MKYVFSQSETDLMLEVCNTHRKNYCSNDHALTNLVSKLEGYRSEISCDDCKCGQSKKLAQ